MYKDFCADKDNLITVIIPKKTKYFEKTNKKVIGKFKDEALGIPIGPLHLAILVVQNRHAWTQRSHWDKTNKGIYHLKLCIPFVGLAPVRLLRPSMAVLYHVNGKLPWAYY